MTITDHAPIAFDPYDYAFQEDPYPVYARLREQEPLHYNEQHDLWVLSRYDDIQHALRTEGTYSNRMGVTIDRSAWNKDAHKVMSFLALDPPDHIRIRSLVATGVHAPPGPRARAADPGAHRALPRPGAGERQLRLDQGLRRPTAHGRHLRDDGRAPGRP